MEWLRETAAEDERTLADDEPGPFEPDAASRAWWAAQDVAEELQEPGDDFREWDAYCDRMEALAAIHEEGGRP